MRRLFGGKKKEEVKAPAPPEPQVNLEEHVAKTEAKLSGIEAQLKPLEDEIRQLYGKYKSTTLTSEKQYIKTRLAQKLAKRQQLTQQLTRQANSLGMMTKIQANIDNVKETEAMATALRQTNQVMQNQMKRVDYDQFRDNIDDMNELAHENDMLAQEINDQFEMNITDDVDEQLANMENELQLQEVMNKKGEQYGGNTYDPLR